ncbi:MAG TPA: DUF4410 domain-containing protein [Thermodesulfobacteriota bacterium]|nr:DUF4410 domain-containing protein [Thermodesulfobacteriota bacterium]
MLKDDAVSEAGEDPCVQLRRIPGRGQAGPGDQQPDQGVRKRDVQDRPGEGRRLGIADSVAKHLVQQIQTLGFFAERASGQAPQGGNILEIEGQFITIDEGNRTERVIIGLGAGRTDVKTYIQLYDARRENRILAAQYQVDAKSGRKPGMAEMTAVGALGGHALVSALVSGGLAGVSEMYVANVDADGKRTAQEIVAKALGPFFVSQGWIPQSMLGEKGLLDNL